MEYTAPTVMLIRGNSLNPWEGRAWNNLPGWSVTGVCARRNLYPLEGLSYPVVTLKSSVDNRLVHAANQVMLARQQTMFGLERLLQKATIAHTAEIYYYYTQQAVQAKMQNPRLRVVTTVWDNSLARFDGQQWPGPGVAPQWWLQKIKTIIARNAQGVDQFLAVTQSAANTLEKYGVSAHKIKIITPAIVPGVITSNTDVDRILADARPYWVVVNRLVPEKGTEDVIKAWTRYSGNSQERLVIVGSGPERTKLETLVKELGIEKSVIFISSVPNSALRPLYESAQALVLGSLITPVWEEQFGYVLAEAITAGCPVIATRTGAIPEVVGEAGVLVTPKNLEQFEKAFEMVSQSTVRAQLRVVAQEQGKHFSQTRFQTELLSIYNRLAQ